MAKKIGKASKWIRNFLIGKKEDKKKNDTSFSIEYHTSETQEETPNVKRKWSFRKLSGKGPNFKLSNSTSFESADTPKLTVQALAEPIKSQQKHQTSLAVTCRVAENAAATKIQAVFRSFLARKALHALKGLVKLQALVRGHLVRKQTASTLRGMHALMSIQVRARVQRIQLAEEIELSMETQSSKRNTITQENIIKEVLQKQKNGHHQNETRSVVTKSTSGYLNHYEINKKDTISHSGPLSISKQHQYEDSCFSEAGKSPLNYPSTMIKTKSTGASTSQHHPNCAERMTYYNYLLLPNYMAKTESSRAKVRSQSEPKQRPKESKKQKSKHIETTDGMHAFVEDQVLGLSTSQFKFNGVENYDPLFMKLYCNGKSLEDNKYDSISTATSQSNYYEYLATYEPNWSLY